MATPFHVAIIGAGPSGLCLALALELQGIRATVFEARGPDFPLSGGLVLSPNGLRLLERLGVYQRILPYGFQFDSSVIVTEQGEEVDRHYYGHERLYGYKALRVSRQIFLRELAALLKERNIETRYHSRFSGVSSDTPQGVTFEVNGQLESASVLVGADGIRSNVRKHLSAAPLTYTGWTGVTSIVPRAEIRYQRPDYPLSGTVRGPAGAFIVMAEDPKALTTTAATQRPFPELDRAGWQELQSDSDKLKAWLRDDFDAWGDMNKSIIEAMCRHADTLLLWPYYAVPNLDSWTSQTRRVVLVGDSAHALPPSSGQGISQAVEDVYTLAFLLARHATHDHRPLDQLLDFWQRWRMERLQQIRRLTELINIKRLPEAERKKHADIPGEDLENVQEGEGQYAWLFNTDIDGELEAWLTAGK